MTMKKYHYYQTIIFFVLAGVVEANDRTPIMFNEDYILQIQLFYELAYELVMRLVGIVQLRLSRFSETNIVHGHNPSNRLNIRHHITPEITRSRITMKEQKDLPLSLIDVMHLLRVDFNKFALVWKIV